jgi:CheY-like chemotaxis protein
MSPNATILCIDDEALGLRVRKMVLEKAGYKVFIAIGGSQGLSLFGSEAVDAVVLDYSMPGMDGAAVAAAMRRSRPEVPIMLLSAYMTLPEKAAGLVDMFVTKGRGPETLLQDVAKLLQIAHGPRSEAT